MLLYEVMFYYYLCGCFFLYLLLIDYLIFSFLFFKHVIDSFFIHLFRWRHRELEVQELIEHRVRLQEDEAALADIACGDPHLAYRAQLDAIDKALHGALLEVERLERDAAVQGKVCGAPPYGGRDVAPCEADEGRPDGDGAAAHGLGVRGAARGRRDQDAVRDHLRDADDAVDGDPRPRRLPRLPLDPGVVEADLRVALPGHVLVLDLQEGEVVHHGVPLVPPTLLLLPIPRVP